VVDGGIIVSSRRAELLVDFKIIKEAELVPVISGFPLAQIWIRAAVSSHSQPSSTTGCR